MRVAWLRGRERIAFTSPSVFFCLGGRGSGKSSLLESIGIDYMREGAAILDLFSSRDGESLAWLRSPEAQGKRIMLIHGDNVSLNCSYEARPVSKVRVQDFETYDLMISSSPLYSSPSDEFREINRILDLIYKRLHWRRLVYTVIREAANIFYSRLKVEANQTASKASMIYLLRESRHMGMALGLDSLRFTAIDIDIRSLVDYLILKSQGMFGLASDLSWIYGYLDPSAVRNMPVNAFGLLSRTGALGVGIFSEVPWHKKPHEDILNILDIKPEYGDELVYPENRGAYDTIGDQEHSEIIQSHVEGLSMSRIAKARERSSASIFTQIQQHNEALAKHGFCSACKRAGSQLFDRRAEKPAQD